MRKHLELPEGTLLARKVTPGAYEASQLCPVYKMEVHLLRAVEIIYETGDVFCGRAIGRYDGSARDAWFMSFRKKIQPGYPRGGGTQIFLHFFVNSTIGVHL